MENSPGAFPRSISEYTLLEFLGEGATAQVYLAEHEASGAHVAIKVIDKLLVRRTQLEDKVRQEMVLHAELRHPHVLQVESVFEDARNYYMVLEYCAQRSLSAVVKALPSRKLDEQTAKKIFRQVVAGVTYLHASGVIHRDLKLANLLLSDTGEVKISDFGLATRLGDDHVTMCGTPNFMAPEVLLAEQEPYNDAVDVWSLGCILYCLLLGNPPFEGRKVGDTLENVANAANTPLQFPDGFSASASDLIQRLLTPDPQSRPSAPQILLHPWLREPFQKRGPSLARAKRQLSHRPKPVPPHPRAASRSPENLRDGCKGSASCSPQKKVLEVSSSSLSVAAGSKQRILKDCKQRGHWEASRNTMNTRPHQLTSAASSSDSFSPDNVSMTNEGSGDLSELSLSTIFSDHSVLEPENDTVSQDDPKFPLLNDSSRARPVVSVVLHLQVHSISCFGLYDDHKEDARGPQLQLQWSCKEPVEIGSPPTFELNVSNGWQVFFDPALGVLTATSSEGEKLQYEIPGVSQARAGSNEDWTSTAPTFHRTRMPLLVRFCQCLALRSMQLRRMALRNQTRKLPLIQYDTLPESLLTSFQYRSSLLTNPSAMYRIEKRRITQNDSDCSQSIQSATKDVEIPGVGYGWIESTGDLKVTFLDGAQLTLAASGLQLRFRPSWAKEADDEDIFELLTSGSMSAFLPSAVKQKLESIPEIIRRLKGTT